MSLMEKRIETPKPTDQNHCIYPWEWMSLMEKRIETLGSGGLFQRQVKENEWALWKKGLRRNDDSILYKFHLLRMNEPYGKKDWDPLRVVAAQNPVENEWALWKKGLRRGGSMCIWFFDTLEWMSLMEKRIETNTPCKRIFRPYYVNEWALWKKGLRLMD